MITARIQIEDGPVLDTYQGWGFIVMEQSHRFAPPEKPRDTSSYSWEPGEHQDPRTTDAPFDYKTGFLIETPNSRLESANAKISAWNDAVREKRADGTKRCKTVTLYDDRMRCKIVGIPEIIEEPKDFYRMQDGSAADCVEVELVIHVNNPALCDFDMDPRENEELPVNISLRTDGAHIYIDTSRPLAEDEIPVLLTRCVRRNTTNYTSRMWRSKFRWHVAAPIIINRKTDEKAPWAIIRSDGRIDTVRAGGASIDYRSLGHKLLASPSHTRTGYYIPRGHGSNYLITPKRPQCRLCFGIAVYRPNIGPGKSPVRLSNVAYFRAEHKLVQEGDVSSRFII